MKLKLKKDLNKRHLFKNNEINNLIYKLIINNQILPINIRSLYYNKIKLGSISKIRNRCLITGRSRGIIKEWGITRMQFKLLADQGYIPGIKRASW